MLHRPSIILADEPTAALDWQHGEEAVRLLDRSGPVRRSDAADRHARYPASADVWPRLCASRADDFLRSASMKWLIIIALSALGGSSFTLLAWRSPAGPMQPSVPSIAVSRQRD